METSDFLPKSSPSVVNRYEESVMKINRYLNQGNLFRIYELLDTMRGIEDRRTLEELFVEKFGFNYRRFI